MIARTTRTLFEIMAASVLGIMLLAGGAAWRLAQGPIPLNFLTQHFERALNGHGAPFRVTLERTNLAWAGWDRALDLRVVGVRATGEDGKLIARVPEMSISVSLGALLRGIIAPRNLDLIGAGVRLVRTRTGEFAMTLGGSDHDSGADLLGRLVEVLSAAPDPDRPMTYLRRISILGAGLTIDDRLTGAVWGARQADIILLREQGEIRGAFFAELDVGGSSTRMNGAASWRPGSDIVRVEAELTGARIDRIAAKLPALRAAEAVRLGVSGRVELTVALSGALRTARFDLTAGDGHVTWSSLWPEGLPVKSAHLRGQFDGDTETLDLDAFAVELGSTRVSGRAAAIRVGDGIAIDGRVEVDRIALSEIGRYWPVSVGRLARVWVLKNMPEGIAEDGRAAISLRMSDPASGEVSLASLSGSLRLRDTTIHYLDGLPPVRDAAATAIFSRDRFIAKVREGTAAGLHVGGGTVRLTALDTNDEQAAIEASVDGALADVLALVDRPPLGFASRFGLQPRNVDGQAATRLVVALPLKRSVELAEIRIEATSRLRDVRVPRLVYGHAVAAKALSLKVNKSRLEVSGEARVAEVPATVRWLEWLDDGERYRRRYEAQATLDDGQRAALGLAGLGPYVQGPVSVDLVLQEPVRGPTEITLDAGLKDASLTLPPVRWRKAPGADGSARLVLLAGPDGALQVREFDVRTPSLTARGSLALDRDRRLADMELRQFTQGRTDLTGTVGTRPDGRLLVRLEGSGLDAAPFLKESDSGDGERAPLPPMVIRADIGRVWINDRAPFENVAGELVWDGSGWSAMDLSAGADQQISLSYDTAGPAKRILLQAEDAGAFLGTLDVVETMQGGKLVLLAQRKDGEGGTPWAGSLRISDFVLLNAPLMARLLTAASLTGIADMMAGNGIRFARLDMPLTYRDGVVAITNARTVGSELGITAEGDIDTNRDRIALSGTVVPAYTLNSLLGNIPVLGNILTGKKGSGIFAATYRVDGAIRNPTVTVNPLAALAPGFLRNLIGIFDGTTRPDRTPPPRGEGN